MIVDLQKLEYDTLDLYSKIFLDIQLDYNNLISDIYRNNNITNPLLFSNILSRNLLQSDLFINCVNIILIDNLIRNNDLREVIVYNKTLYKQILFSFPKLKVTFKNKNHSKKKIENLFFKPILDIIRIIIQSIHLIYIRNRKRRMNLINSDKVILLDSFLFDNSFKSEKFIDRNYTDYDKYILKELKDKIFLLPTIYYNFFSRKILDKIYNNSSDNLVFKYDFLKISDYIDSLFLLFNQNIKPDKYTLRNIDISLLIQGSHKYNKFSFQTFYSLLNYKFIGRLKELNINIEGLIDWNENQPHDRALIKAMKDYYPNVLTKAYQGFIISYDYHFYLCPIKEEVMNSVIADEICVVGSGLNEYLKKFTSMINVKVAPSFRFIDSKFSNISESNNKNKILLVLPINYLIAVKQVIFLHDIISKSNFNYLKLEIKPHPSYNIENLKKQIENLDNISIVTDDFVKIVNDYDIVLGNTTSALVEAASNAVPVIIIPDMNNFTQNPIPANISSKIWIQCKSKNEIILSIQRFLGYNSNQKKELKVIASEIKEKYFHEVNNETVNQFFNFQK